MHHAPETTRAKHRGDFVKQANQREILCGVNWSYARLYEPYQKLYLSTDIFSPEFEEIQAEPQDVQARVDTFKASQKSKA